MRVVLDEADFRTLVSGGVVRKEGIEITLADIGFATMEQSIAGARDGVLTTATPGQEQAP